MSATGSRAESRSGGAAPYATPPPDARGATYSETHETNKEIHA
jgi:hypothetical protein